MKKAFSAFQDSDWNKYLEETNCLFYQSDEWASVKKFEGWSVKRYSGSSGNYSWYAQIFIKRIPLIGKNFILFTGFPAYKINQKNSVANQDILSKILCDFIECVKSDNKNYIFRLHLFNKYNSQLAFNLEKMNCYPVISKQTGNLSSEVELTNIDALLDNVRSTWRHCYKKAEKHPLVFREDFGSTGIKNLYNLYRQTFSKKNLNTKYDMNYIERMLSTSSKSYVPHIYTTYLDDEPVASSLFVTCNDRATYLLSGISLKGRDVFASYFNIYKALQDLSNRDINLVDLGGVSPLIERVYTFKMGLRGDLVTYLGNWETTDSQFSSNVINSLLVFKDLWV